MWRLWGLAGLEPACLPFGPSGRVQVAHAQAFPVVPSMRACWSRAGFEPASSPGEGAVLPLNYLTLATALLVTQFAVGLVLRDVSWQREQGSNLRPAVLETAALLTELSLHGAPVFSGVAGLAQGEPGVVVVAIACRGHDPKRIYGLQATPLASSLRELLARPAPFWWWGGSGFDASCVDAPLR